LTAAFISERTEIVRSASICGVTNSEKQAPSNFQRSAQAQAITEFIIVTRTATSQDICCISDSGRWPGPDELVRELRETAIWVAGPNRRDFGQASNSHNGGGGTPGYRMKSVPSSRSPASGGFVEIFDVLGKRWNISCFHLRNMWRRLAECFVWRLKWDDEK